MEAIQAVKTLFGRTIPSSGNETGPIKYRCELCQDTGWIHEEDELFRRYARKCRCQEAREAEARLRASGLADAVKEQTFESFEVHTTIQARMKKTADEYLSALLEEGSQRKPWLFVGGNPGSGKTHLCTAVCGELLRHNIGVRYFQWLQESRRLKASINDEGFEDLIQDYLDAQVLYIDDLLKGRYVSNPSFTDADIKLTFSILNPRYLMNLPTIISSEWGLLEDLLPADEGVFSRVYERCRGYCLSIDRDPANNYRLMKKTS